MGRNYFMNEPAPEGERAAILVAGHSWAEGAFLGHEGEVGSALGLGVEARTKVGSGIDYAKSEIGKANGNYRCALLFTGINDYWRPIDEINKRFDSAIGAALAKTGGQVYLVNVPYYDKAGKDKIDWINEHLKSMAAKNPRIICIDLNAELNGKNHPEYSSKNLHPSSYEGVRKFVVAEIAKKENALAAEKKMKSAR